jgi:hypothetical protein
MTLADALLWLNDRLGTRVTALIAVERGDLEISILEAGGELRHWSEDRGADRAASRDDVAGLYDVGGAALDLSDVRPLEVKALADDHLLIRLDETTTLQVVEQAEI